MNNKIAKQLNAKNLYNDWDIIRKGHPVLYIRTPSGYRDVTPRAVVLHIKGFKFKDVGWYQHGNKWFPFSGKEQREEALREAFDWIDKNFPKIKMVKSPFSRFAWIPEEDLKEVLNKSIKP